MNRILDKQTLDRIHFLENELTNQIRSCSKILDIFSVDNYLDALSKWPLRNAYNKPHEEMRCLDQYLSEKAEGESEYLYRKLILIKLIQQIDSNILKKTLPEKAIINISEVIRRIIQDMQIAQNTIYSLNHDFYLKDLAVCLLRMIPGGMRLIELSSGVPRSLLYNGYSKDLFKKVFFFIGCGGFSPMYELHTDIRDTSRFNETGSYELFSLIAELMILNPEIKGVFGGSWFYDPALKKISPWLSYLRDLPEQNGGAIFYSGHDQGAAENATATSQKRKKMYEEKKYFPKNFFMIWPREQILKWKQKIGR